MLSYLCEKIMKRICSFFILALIIVGNLNSQIINKKSKFDVTKQKKVTKLADVQQLSMDSVISWLNIFDYGIDTLLESKDIYKYNAFGLETLSEFYEFNYETFEDIDTSYFRSETRYDNQNRVIEYKHYSGQIGVDTILSQKNVYVYSQQKPEMIHFFYQNDNPTNELKFISKTAYYMSGDLEDSIKIFNANNEYTDKIVNYFSNWQEPDSVYYYSVSQNIEQLSAIDKWQYNSLGKEIEYINYGFDGENILPNLKNQWIYNQNNKLERINNYIWSNDNWQLASYSELVYENNTITEIGYYNDESKKFVAANKTVTCLNINGGIDTISYYNMEGGQWVGDIRMAAEYNEVLMVDDVVAPEYYFYELGSNYVPNVFKTYYWNDEGWFLAQSNYYYYNVFVPTNNRTMTNNNLVVYPNPVSDFLIVNANRNTKYEIVDMQGKVVKTATYNGSFISINDLESGIYVLRVKDLNNYKSKTFVKK